MRLDAAVAFDTDLADMPELARAAERIGFGAIWTAETSHDPFLPIALGAEHTNRLRFGTAVAIAFARSPTVVAHTAWDLARLSGGRFILGLGTQVRPHVERRFGMPWSGRPVAQLREYVGALRAVWRSWQDGEPLSFRGEHYRLTLMTPFFAPAPIQNPAIPIHLAGVGAPLARLAGEVADGFAVHPLHSPSYLDEVIRPAVAAGAAAAGRETASVALSGSLIVALDDGEIAAARRQVAFYASTPSYRRVLAHHGWESVGLELSELARHARWEEMGSRITDDMLDAFAIVGSWEDLAGRLRDRYAERLDRVALYRSFVPGVEDDRWTGLVARLAGG
ncbi:MAG: TIGR03617 family F420-dependent LLM class oxidoreductase [Candidatus Limnocylindria bacterium]